MKITDRRTWLNHNCAVDKRMIARVIAALEEALTGCTVAMGALDYTWDKRVLTVIHVEYLANGWSIPSVTSVLYLQQLYRDAGWQLHVDYLYEDFPTLEHFETADDWTARLGHAPKITGTRYRLILSEGAYTTKETTENESCTRTPN